MLIFGIALAVLSIYFAAKNANTYLMRELVDRGVADYVAFKIRCEQDYEFNPSPMALSKESYFKTLLRFWDWGYNHIVPAWVLEDIRPYVEWELYAWKRRHKSLL